MDWAAESPASVSTSCWVRSSEGPAAAECLPEPASVSRRSWESPRRSSRWLASVPERQDGIWIVYRKKASPLEGPVYDDLVEEALCFGWIDSRVRRVDDERVMQWFSPRRPGGIWSALNKERIERLVFGWKSYCDRKGHVIFHKRNALISDRQLK